MNTPPVPRQLPPQPPLLTAKGIVNLHYNKAERDRIKTILRFHLDRYHILKRKSKYGLRARFLPLGPLSRFLKRFWKFVKVKAKSKQFYKLFYGPKLSDYLI